MTRAIAFCALFAVAACDQQLPAPVTGLESFSVTLVDPDEAHRGTADQPFSGDHVVIDVAAFDAHGNPYTAEPGLKVDVYLTYTGNKIGALTPCGTDEDVTPLVQLTLDANGQALHQTVPLTKAFGVANIWVQDHVPSTAPAGAGSRGFGSSSELTFPSPTIPDIQRPLMPYSSQNPQAAYCTPWNGKQVIVTHGTPPNGQLVVTAVFPNAFVVTDTGAPYSDELGPDKSGYNNIFVFTYIKPPDWIAPGRIFGELSGNMSKFVGFTELNFPYETPASAVEAATLPEPYKLDLTTDPKTGVNDDIGNTPKLLALSGALATMTGRVCAVDETNRDWIQFNTFQLMTGVSCDSFTSFGVAMPSKVYGTFDPLKLAKKTVQVTGMLKNMSGQNEGSVPPTTCSSDADCDPTKNPGLTSGTHCIGGTCKKGAFNFWTIVPRTPDDLVVLDQ